MKFWKPAALTLALAAAYPGVALAQSNADLLKEMKALRDRVGELEKKLAEKSAPAPVPAPAAAVEPSAFVMLKLGALPCRPAKPKPAYSFIE